MSDDGPWCYRCDECETEGPSREVRRRAARDAQQHDVGFHGGRMTCDVVPVEVATDGGRDEVVCGRCGAVVNEEDEGTPGDGGSR